MLSQPQPHAAALLIGLLLANVPLLTRAQETTDPPTRKHNPGYLHGGLNYSLNTRAPDVGLILGYGSEFYPGQQAGKPVRFGINVGWVSISANVGGDRSTCELQAVKPGFLVTASLSSAVDLTFKYSAMPTGGYNFGLYLDDDHNNSHYYYVRDFWHAGVSHGPYFGMTYKKFMLGVEYVLGKYWSEIDEDKVYYYYSYERPYYSRSANTFRFLLGFNW